MDILYRRFLLFTAFVAVLGVFAANLIIETKRPMGNFSNPVNIQANCKDLRMCAVTPNKSVFVINSVLRG